MSRPVIYVPGLPGSHLFDTEQEKRIFLTLGFSNPGLQGPDDLQAAEPIRAGFPVRRAASLLIFDIAKQAESLYELLENIDIDPVRIGWDWRRPVYDDVFSDPDGPFSIQHRLTAAIRSTRQDTGKKVVILVHSTGGLIVRSLLEENPALVDDIDFVMAFGVPWAGAPRSMQGINGQTGFAGLVSAEKAQRVLARSWAGWDLFPPDPTHLRDRDGNPLTLTFRKLGSGNLRQQASALTDTDWINSLPSELQAGARQRAAAAHGHLGARRPTFDLQGNRLRLINVVGWGYPTPVEAELIGSGSTATLNVLPESTQDETLDGGDGTAARRSAAWIRSGADLDVSTYEVPVGWLPSSRTNVHNRLWSNPGGINLLNHHLAGQQLKDFCYAALDADDSSAQSETQDIRVRLVALAADGSPLEQAKVRTRNLQGSELTEDFDPAFGGRHLMKIPRARIRKSNSGACHLILEIGWRADGREHWQPRRFTFLG